jgi:hypothetical protein
MVWARSHLPQGPLQQTDFCLQQTARRCPEMEDPANKTSRCAPQLADKLYTQRDYV